MSKIDEKATLAATKNKRFIAKCVNKFASKSVVESNKNTISFLQTWSYLPNIISITTAIFFYSFHSNRLPANN